MSLFEAIQNHLSADPGNVVAVVTNLRCTHYYPKHKDFFVADTTPNPAGCWVKTGKSKVYVLPHVVKFGRPVKK